MAEEEDWRVLNVTLVCEPAQAGFGIVEGAFYVGCAGGLAVVAVVDGEDVVAFSGQPCDVEEVAADVLGVAVEKVNGAFWVTFSG